MRPMKTFTFMLLLIIKAFTKNGKATIVPLEPGVKVMGQRNSLSPLDIKQANLLYNCKGKQIRLQYGLLLIWTQY